MSEDRVHPRIAPGFWARLLLRIPRYDVGLHPTSLVAQGGGETRELAVERIEEVVLTRRGLWCVLTIRVAGARRPVLLRGLPRSNASRFLSLLQARRAAALVARANRAFEQLCEMEGYVRRSQLRSWKSRYEDLEGRLRELELRGADLRKKVPAARAFLGRLDDGEAIIDLRNDTWVGSELEARSAWFDGVAQHPLTPRQREAIVRDEDTSLVVAGPGTGKTSTVIAKIAYLLEVRGVPADEVLVLSFSCKTVSELEERARESFDAELEIRTFHALGLDIIAEVEGEKPSLSRLAEDDLKLHDFLKQCVDDLLANPSLGPTLRRFLIEHLRPRHTSHEFESKEDYIQWLQGQDLRSYQGDRVKSQEELVIANWLYCNGIPYVYEAKYEIETATRLYSQYKPDFHLPEHGIYIEHFGIDRDGCTPPWIDAESYREGMEWKRALHREHGTELVESYSYEHREDRLIENLEQKLRALGVESTLISEEELRRTLERRGETPRLVWILARFLNLFRSSQSTLAEVRQKAGAGGQARRSQYFLEVFEAVHERYERHLADAGEIDFHDMINRATGYLRSGRISSRFRYILIDEFQDIAHGRYQLVKALIDARSDARAFLVGDDCQAIYRFTGSDVSIMTGVEAHFGFTRRTELDRTFRLDAGLLKLSSSFIGSNPHQLGKCIEAWTSRGGKAATLWFTQAGEERDGTLRRVLDAINADSQGKAASLLVIGRYNFSRPQSLQALLDDHPEIEARYVTAHGSKGLEADYVVIVDVVADRYGFPCEIADDPLLDLVMTDPEPFPQAEERRLFYVALTRARRHAHILTSEGNPSAFATELCRPSYREFVAVEGHTDESAPCPGCGGHTLVRRSGPFGMFWGCQRFPYCEYRPLACSSCGEGVLLPRKGGFECSTAECGARERACPSCRDGVLVSRTSQYGEFLGCSNYTRRLPPCTHREPL